MNWNGGLAGLFLAGLIGAGVQSSAAADTTSDNVRETNSIFQSRAEENAEPFSWDAERYARADRAFSVLYPRTIEKHHVLLSLDHRAFTPVDDHPGRNLLGFDTGNLKIGLGLRYGLLDNLDLAVGRYNGTTDDFDVYEFSLRCQVVNEQKNGFDGAFVLGLSAFDEPEREDFYGTYAELLAGKTFFRRLYPTVGIMHHSESTGIGKTADDDQSSLAVATTLNALLVDRLALVSEWSFPVAGYNAGYPAWVVGLKYSTWGHSFSLVLSNTQNISSDGLVAGSDRLARPIIGFTITRLL
ncbi:MAG: hypothetical protein HYV35_06095 [Lentisphaerae bacterium]|nr:hypothetical protein [Lentisphaerota bacterium]